MIALLSLSVRLLSFPQLPLCLRIMLDLILEYLFAVVALDVPVESMISLP